MVLQGIPTAVRIPFEDANTLLLGRVASRRWMNNTGIGLGPDAAEKVFGPFIFSFLRLWLGHPGMRYGIRVVDVHVLDWWRLVQLCRHQLNRFSITRALEAAPQLASGAPETGASE